MLLWMKLSLRMFFFSFLSNIDFFWRGILSLLPHSQIRAASHMYRFTLGSCPRLPVIPLYRGVELPCSSSEAVGACSWFKDSSEERSERKVSLSSSPYLVPSYIKVFLVRTLLFTFCILSRWLAWQEIIMIRHHNNCWWLLWWLLVFQLCVLTTNNFETEVV